jgi:ribosomal protein S18 acetylase RimI-like enzyme
MHIRSLIASDVSLLTEFFDKSPWQPERGLELQHRGEGDFLVAWEGDSPLGWVMVHWLAEPHAPIGWQGKVANLEDLLVLQERRNQGVGTAILLEAANLVRARGQSHVSLGVGLDNPNARRLYERLGYREAGLPPVTDGGEFVDRNGKKQKWQETWVFMVKDLGVVALGDLDGSEQHLLGPDSSLRSE